jgi:F0F1-type ATP synthase membrane subunit b/b'
MKVTLIDSAKDDAKAIRHAIEQRAEQNTVNIVVALILASYP